MFINENTIIRDDGIIKITASADDLKGEFMLVNFI